MPEQKTVKDFQEVINRKFDTKITLEEAKEILLGLVDYFDLLSAISHR